MQAEQVGIKDPEPARFIQEFKTEYVSKELFDKILAKIKEKAIKPVNGYYVINDKGVDDENNTNQRRLFR